MKASSLAASEYVHPSIINSDAPSHIISIHAFLATGMKKSESSFHYPSSMETIALGSASIGVTRAQDWLLH
jgi:hypothetical protein